VSVDLALEAHELARGRTGREIPGVAVHRETYPHATVTIVRVLDERAETVMGKPRGTYVTIEAPVMRENNRQAHREVVRTVGAQLASLLRINDDAQVLLVGLGNWHATPDSLGPKVVDYSLITRHLYRYAPQELKGGIRPVCAIAPGVLGTTGIETSEIIRGLVEKIQPALIIAIDALAAQNVNRIATTVQMADTGIQPGSGVGTMPRAGINRETMGTEVIAMGVPTVVRADTIARDALQHYLMRQATIANRPYQPPNREFVDEVVEGVLAPFGAHLMVTPKEIDELIENAARILAGGIAAALHRSLTAEEYCSYLQ